LRYFLQGVTLKIKVFTIITLLAIGNIGYANQEATASSNSLIAKNHKRQRSNIQNEIIKYLTDIGLEQDTVDELISNAKYIPDNMAYEVLKTLNDVSYKSFVEVLSKRILYKQNVDLLDSNVLMGIAHSLKGLNISDKTRKSLLNLVENTIV
jgi:hypothetical protein